MRWSVSKSRGSRGFRSELVGGKVALTIEAAGFGAPILPTHSEVSNHEA